MELEGLTEIWADALKEFIEQNYAEALCRYDELDSALGKWESTDDVEAAWLRLVASQGFFAAKEVGAFSRALEFAEKECLIAEGFPQENYGLARALNNRGVASMELGRLVSAEADLLKALHESSLTLDDVSSLFDTQTLSNQIQDNLSVLKTLQGLAPIEDSSNSDHTRGQQHRFQFPLRTSETHGNIVNDAFMRTFVADANGDSSEATKIQEEAVAALRTKSTAPKELGIALSNLGHVYLRSGEVDKAIPALEESVTILQGTPRPSEPLALSLQNISEAHFQEGSVTQAVDRAKEAWLEIDKVAPDTPQALIILHQLVKLRVLTEDFRRARAGLQHAMSLYDANRRFFASSEAAHIGSFATFRGLTELMLLISTHEQFPDEAFAWVERAKARFWNERLDELDSERSSSDADWEPERLSEELSPSAQFVSLSDFVLDPNCLMLNFFVGENWTFVAWCYNRRFGVYRLNVGHDALAQMVKDYSMDICSSSRRQLWRDSGAELADLLFRGISLERSVNKIVVSPDGPIWFLPFDLLPYGALHTATADWRQDGSFGETISEHCVTALVPNAEVLKRLRSKSDQWDVERRHLLIISRSTFSSIYPDLTYVNDEVLNIATIWKEHSVQILKDQQAVRESVLPALEEADFIHIATHVIADPADDRPAIVLSDGKGGTDMLTPNEIIERPIKASLVFLSACSSAIGRPSIGEGLMSVARSFLLAGASSVIASLWPVVDRETALFVESFYDALFEGLSPATALSRAKNECLAKGFPISGLVAFQLIGDGHDPLDRTAIREMIIREVEGT